MHAGKAPLTEYLRADNASSLCRRYCGEHKIERFTGLEQFLCLALAQLTYRERQRAKWNGINSIYVRTLLNPDMEVIGLAARPAEEYRAFRHQSRA
jgi:hypothetical protein